MSAVYDFTLEQGATFSKTVQFLDENEDPIDLTGYTAALDIRTYPGAADPVLFRFDTTPSGTEGTITITASTGTLVLTASSTLTGGLTAWAHAVYDLKLKDGSGNVYNWLSGRFHFEPRVTVAIP